MQLLQSRHLSPFRWIPRLLYLLVAAGVIASWLNRDTLLVRYRLWKQERALSQAREFIDRHDAANAELALRVAIVAVPGNLPTLRAAADMLEQVASPQAMRLRRTVVQLAPDSAEDQAAFVLCCIKFNDLNAARDAMSGIPPKTAATPVALNAALAYALTTGDRPMADVIFQQLEKFYPKSGLLQFDHNRLRLKLPKGPAQQAAQRELTDLAQADPKLAPQIYREFAADAIQRGDYAFAKHWLAMVLADPSATVTDRIQEANIELVIDRKPFESVYPPLAALAAQKPDEITSFVRWLIVQNRADEAVKLLGGLPAAVRDRPDIKRSEADCLAQMKDWDGLLPMVERGAWGPVSVTAVGSGRAGGTPSEATAVGCRMFDSLAARLMEVLRKSGWPRTTDACPTHTGHLVLGSNSSVGRGNCAGHVGKHQHAVVRRRCPKAVVIHHVQRVQVGPGAGSMETATDSASPSSVHAHW